MNLVASAMCRNERGRYLAPFLEHLLGFCDEVRVLDDGSDDGSRDLLLELSDERPVLTLFMPEPGFYAHEGRRRQQLLEWTLEPNPVTGTTPTHVLAVDADEFVSDGQALRAACERDAGNGAWTLPMEEVWAVDERHLWTRQDGGWRTHPVPVLYRVPERRGPLWRIQDRQLACGREPLAVRALAGKALPSGSSLLHLGWANRGDRQARYDRYVEADGGRFHASSHLRSILAPDRRVKLAKREWPEALEPYKGGLLERVNREAVSA